MVASWLLVIVCRLVSLPITWAGRGLWWPAGLLLLSGGWYLCLLRGQGRGYGGQLSSCYCLEVGISAYHVGRAGVMVAGWLLVIV